MDYTTELVREEDFPSSMPMQFVEKYIIAIIELLVCILVVANNTVLIFAISKFSRLQTRTNYILLNFAIITAAYAIVNTTLVILWSFVDIGTYGNTFFVIFIVTAYYLLTQLALIFAVLLSIDWYIIVTNFKNLSSTYQRTYKCVIGWCYAIPLICLVPAFIFGYHFLSILDFFLIVICIISIVIILVINGTKHCRSYNEDTLNSAYIVSVSNIYFFMWLPHVVLNIGFFIYSIFPNTSRPAALNSINQCFYIFPVISPIVMTWVLIKRDPNFKLSYDIIFKRSVNAGQDAESGTYEEKKC